MVEEVDSFKYLGSVIGMIGEAVEDVVGRVNEGAKVLGAVNRLWKVRSVGLNLNFSTGKVSLWKAEKIWLQNHNRPK